MPLGGPHVKYWCESAVNSAKMPNFGVTIEKLIYSYEVYVDGSWPMPACFDLFGDIHKTFAKRKYERRADGVRFLGRR